MNWIRITKIFDPFNTAVRGIVFEYFIAVLFRPVTRGSEAPITKLMTPLEKCVEHSLKQWFLTFSPSRPPKVIFLWLTPPLL